jgi:hypothetical protein
VTVDEARRRDGVLRAYLEGRDWDAGAEAALTRELVAASAELLPSHPYLVDYEWDEVPGRTEGGRGDLLFSDGQSRFAVVEVKSVYGSGDITSRRSKVDEQARRYRYAVQERFPDAEVSAWVYSDDELYPGLRDALGPRRPGRVPSPKPT